MQRRIWIALTGWLGLLGGAVAGEPSEPAATRRPNVLFIAVDDLNDWVGCLGGHPQAKTPHIDRLAAQGVVFANAHCAAPLCNPSRTSVLTGRHPRTSGVYGNTQDWRDEASLADAVTLPVHFRRHGYYTASGGKIYHANHGGFFGALTGDENSSFGGRSGYCQPDAWHEGFPAGDVQLPRAPLLLGTHRNGIVHHWDWGPLDHPPDATEDGQISRWAAQWLEQPRSEPFFLAVGIYRPHDPQYAPARFFDQHPLAGVQLPDIDPNDLDDVPEAAKRYIQREGSDWQRVIDRHHAHAAAVQAYLASVTFADWAVGRVLDALAASPHADTTIVCLWSDHGYHLGEKRKFHKGTLWEEATRVPLVIVAPGVTASGGVCQQAVSLIDLYPTLCELCGLPQPAGLDGDSLVPQLRDPTTGRSRPAITSRGPGEHSVRSQHWRYTRYGDGSEELYNHQTDPRERDNLAGKAEFAEIKARLARWLY